MTSSEHNTRAALKCRILSLTSAEKIQLEQLNQKAINAHTAGVFDEAAARPAPEPVKFEEAIGLNPVIGQGWDGHEYRVNADERPRGGRLSVSGWASNRKSYGQQLREQQKEKI